MQRLGGNKRAWVQLLGCIAFIPLCLILFIKVLSAAWVIDDAYITFRVVDNFVNGFGLRWNVDERVQVFTNPLWLFLHIPFYALKRNIFLITISISFFCTVGAVYLLIRTIPGGWFLKIIFVLIPLWRSRIFCEQMISGLETPLVMLILAWFWYTFFRTPEQHLRLFFIASMAMVNRLDAVVILAPALMYIGIRWVWNWLKHPSIRAFGRATLSFWPIICWLLFSLIYFGFVLPNTYYAKMNTGLSKQDYHWFGHCYIHEQFANYDSFSYLLIGAALLYAVYVAFVVVTRPWFHKKPLGLWQIGVLLAAAGIILHLKYVESVGGDFVPGRFVMAPFFLSVLLLYGAMQSVSYLVFFIATSVLMLVTFQPRLDLLVKPDPEYCRVSDERGFYIGRGFGFVTHGGLLHHLLHGNIYSLSSLHRYVRFNPGATHYIPRQWPMPKNFDVHKKVIIWSMVGVCAYTAGPSQIVIDELALGDPLLARLPADFRIRWRIAHFTRDVPEGYEHARRTGDLSAMRGRTKGLYKRLKVIISGDLFDLSRLSMILQTQWHDIRRLL